ncbi:MAG: hypothetical protein KDD69_00030 [Bdellovibrionales bacterium]|nr:hypothetical protein [Bdellovibrionales bacterium]
MNQVQSNFSRLLLFTVLLIGAADSARALPAFPGAKGFGSDTVGGSGRHLSNPSTTVFKVTNLNDTGSGSLRNCVEASGPRVCVFEVSGTIRAYEPVKIKNPYITIAGQTSPSPGITIRGGRIIIETHDVVVQHIRVRAGDDPANQVAEEPQNRDGLSILGFNPVYNVIVDHVSVSWSIDELISLGAKSAGVRDVTLSHVIGAEALTCSIHPEGCHSMGLLIGEGTKNITIHNSLFAHNGDRNVRLKTDTELEFVNNVVYNWDNGAGRTINGADSTSKVQKFDIVGNYYKKGPESGSGSPYILRIASNLHSSSRFYVVDNICPQRTSSSQNDWAAVDSSVPANPHRSSSRVTPSGTLSNPLSAQEAFDYVLAKAGARPADRDAVDVRIANDVKKGTGSHKDCVSGCSRSAGGWPSSPVNRRTLTIPSNPNGDAGNGYTRLEAWLHTFSGEVEGGGTDTVPPMPPVIIGVEVVN